jgi:hypothetical protein
MKKNKRRFVGVGGLAVVGGLALGALSFGNAGAQDLEHKDKYYDWHPWCIIECGFPPLCECA